MKTSPIYTRATLGTKAANPDDLDRIARYLARLGAWECPCCSELYPATVAGSEHTKQPFGICPDCFINNENCGEYTQLPGCDHDIYALYAKLLKAANIYNHFGPHGSQGSNQAPFEFDLLAFLVSNVGVPKMRTIVANHRPHLNAAYPSGPRAFVNPDKLRWHKEHGYIPWGISPDALPAKTDKAAWETLKTGIWELELDFLVA